MATRLNRAETQERGVLTAKETEFIELGRNDCALCDDSKIYFTLQVHVRVDAELSICVSSARK